MSTKFEQLLDLLINEEHDKAQELFHEIVVEKSREIYENLIAEEDDEMEESTDDEMEESTDEELEESTDDEMEESTDDEMEESTDEDTDESMDLEDSYMMDGDDEDPEAGGMEKTGDFGADIGATDDEMDGAEGGDEDQAIFDIKNAIEELEAAFAQLEKAQGGEMGPDAGFGDEEGEDDDLMMGLGEGRKLREYTEKVGNDWEKSSQKSAGPVGSGKGELAGQTSVNDSHGPVSSGKGKPTTGATAKNILGDTKAGQGKNTGDRPDSLNKGIAQVSGEKFASGLNNVDGKKSGVKTLSKVAGGHGAEKKGAAPGPVGSGSGDKAGQTGIHNTPSPLNGAPNRNR